jgi:uncharacterized protein
MVFLNRLFKNNINEKFLLNCMIRKVPKIYNVVIYIVIANIISYIMQNLIDGYTASMVLTSADLLSRPWMLVTHLFAHGSLMHLIFNMYALFIFGPLVEHRIGSKRFLLVYFISGILAGIGFSLINATSVGLGASGAIMAVLGIVIVLFPDLKVLFFFVIPMSMRTAGIIFALIDIFGFISSVNTGIAHIAHLIGLACGVVYALLLPKIKINIFNKKNQKNIMELDLTMPQEEIDKFFKE